MPANPSTSSAVPYPPSVSRPNIEHILDTEKYMNGQYSEFYKLARYALDLEERFYKVIAKNDMGVLPDIPTIITEGQLFCDDRGEIRSFNSFNPTSCGIKRMYKVENIERGYIRAVHCHQYESKFIIVDGCAHFIAFRCPDCVFAGEKIKNVSTSHLYRFTLNSNKPSILFIPAGYGHGFKTLKENTILTIFSDKTLEESKKDDYRLSWDIFGKEVWENNYR